MTMAGADPGTPAAGGPGSGPPGRPASGVVLGTGLIGTSIALALREAGVPVWLADQDPAAARLAADIGAGQPLPDGEPPGPEPWAELAVLAVPPAAVAPALAAAQGRRLARWYTDVASVKALPLRQAAELGCDLASFVPGHPLSGRERSGPAAARADLFLGRPWVICPDPQTAPAAVAAVSGLIGCCRAELVHLSAADHDRWVALVSHAPHVVAAAMAAQLTSAPAGALGLAGQGLRDVTRVAGGDSALWTQILAANAGPVAQVLSRVAGDLAAAADVLAEAAAGAGAAEGTSVEAGTGAAEGASAAGGARLDQPGLLPGHPALKLLAGLLDEGSAGVAMIPGKRGLPARDSTVVQVVIPDQPGELARLFQVAGDAGVNIEDFGIEHSPGLPVGVAELTVRPDAAGRLTAALAAAGWPVRR
jgi:prephenate dehydrogenase